MCVEKLLLHNLNGCMLCAVLQFSNARVHRLVLVHVVRKNMVHSSEHQYASMFIGTLVSRIEICA